MDASQLLHADLFDLLRQPLGGKTRDMDAWLAGIKTAPPETAALELAQRLATEVAQEAAPEMRFKLLGACDAAAEKILPALEAATEAASLPLTPAALRAALAADSLLKTLATGYVTLMTDVAADKTSDPSGKMLQAAARRATQTLSRRQLVDFRAHASPSAASWKLLHETYRLALGHGLTAADNDGDGTSITREYIAALLFALAEPGRLPREQLGRIHAFIAGLANLARLDAVGAASDEAACRFLVASDPGHPAQSMPRLPEGKTPPPQGLALDCTDIVAEIDRMIAAGAAEPLPLETLRLLRDAWSAAATSPRRFSRMQFKPRVDMIAGLPAILRLLAGKSLGRRQSDSSRREEEESGEWLVINESPDGFGIRNLGGEAPPLAIGDLVVLRPREHGKIHICLVRRGNQGTREPLELGVQLLSSNACVIPLPSEDILAMGQQGILLPQLPAFGNAAGLITAAGALTPRSVITENQAGSLKYYRLGARIATSTAIDFHLLQSA
ncbi:MAG: hypothetical protein Q8O25_13465 [Sulfurisoma sp.]|nr:hypothetical protein [Sulfurisoma sp.]